jgi:hypothetical protein
MSTTRLAYAESYAIKAECGGGYRGAAKNMLTGEIQKGDRRDTIEEARNDAKQFVWIWADGRNMVTGTFKSPKGSWKMNYFIRTDEVTENV